MNVTCGLIVVDPSKRILIAHPTGAGKTASWSFPKGLLDPGETPAQAAGRECFEETGLDVRSSHREFIELGRYKYAREKDIELFLYFLEEEIDLKKLKCTSFFTMYDRSLPEVDQFMLVSAKEAISWLSPKQSTLLSLLLEEDLDLGILK